MLPGVVRPGVCCVLFCVVLCCFVVLLLCVAICFATVHVCSVRVGWIVGGPWVVFGGYVMVVGWMLGGYRVGFGRILGEDVGWILRGS